MHPSVRVPDRPSPSHIGFVLAVLPPLVLPPHSGLTQGARILYSFNWDALGLLCAASQSALKYIHATRIVHCHVKLEENILYEAPLNVWGSLISAMQEAAVPQLNLVVLRFCAILSGIFRYLRRVVSPK